MQYCNDFHLSLEKLASRLYCVSIKILEKLFNILQIEDLTPLIFSQQFEARKLLFEKPSMLHAAGAVVFSFGLRQYVSLWTSEWLSVEIKVCPPVPLHQVR